ncbi:hypothetical protein EVAR_100698_1 [Eumeta japonica]|uniref:Uncharacterized protein n=1 Tax=Eumeta variegata TaxID=151549 RepID=A0A4C1SZZ1_EUMVA|nr:hypothetical protein EVAR_100698_1 [Eumeta japonica]
MSEVKIEDASECKPKDQTIGFGEDKVMTGMSAREAFDLFGGVPFKFEELEAEFAKICPDYITEYGWDDKKFAVEVCAVVLFEIAPARSVSRKR